MNEELWDITKEEVYADRQHHICKNCDDFAVCANMIEGSDTPCEAFEWFPEALYVLTAQQFWGN